MSICRANVAEFGYLIYFAGLFLRGRFLTGHFAY